MARNAKLCRIMRNHLRYLFFLYVVCLSGCVTTQEQRTERLQVKVDQQALLFRVEQLEAQLEDQSQAAQHVLSQLDALRGDIAGLQAAIEMQQRKTADGLAAEQTARNKDKQEIIEHLSRKVAELIAQQNAARQSLRGESGYEHTVQSGETLSQIAAAYKVTVNAIVKANDISNPDNVRAGTKLFIPE